MTNSGFQGQASNESSRFAVKCRRFCPPEGKLFRSGGTNVANDGTGHSEDQCDKPCFFVVGGTALSESLAQLCLPLPLIFTWTTKAFFYQHVGFVSEPQTLKAPAMRQGLNFCQQKLACCTAHYVGCEISFGTFEEFELHGFAFVQGTISIFLNGGKMDEYVFPG